MDLPSLPRATPRRFRVLRHARSSSTTHAGCYRQVTARSSFARLRARSAGTVIARSAAAPMECSTGDSGGDDEAPARKLKRGKVRSAWIAFVGRIVAQV